MDVEEDEEIQFKKAVLVFSHFIGINIETEEYLLSIAEEALSNLPKGWEIGFGEDDNAGIPFFFNTESNESDWHHPQENLYRKKVKDARIKYDEKKMKDKKKQSSEDMRIEEFDEVQDFDNDDVNDNKKDVKNIDIKKDDNKKKTSGGFGLSEEDFSGEDYNNNDIESFNNSPEKSIQTKIATKDVMWVSNDNENTNISGPPISATRNRIDKWSDKNNSFTDNNIVSMEREFEKKDKEDRLRKENELEREKKRKENEKAIREEELREREYENLKEKQKFNMQREKQIDKENRDAEAHRQREQNNLRGREKEQQFNARNQDRDKGNGEFEEKIREIRELKNIIGNYERQVHSLTANNKLLITEKDEFQSKIKDLQLSHQVDLNIQRSSLAKLEERLSDEKEERRSAEERISRLQTDSDTRVRDVEEVAEVRLRDALKRARAETEEDWKERLKSLERRNSDEIQELRSEIANAKRKQEEAQRETEIAKRKITLSKEDGKLESQIEIDKARKEVEDTEQELRVRTNELRKVREEYSLLSAKLASTLQMAQISTAESDAAKAQAMSAVSEGQTSHAALIQAAQRIQQLDKECAELRAQSLLLRRENEQVNLELRKVQGSVSNSGDRITTVEADHRRVKAQLQGEVSRLSSRVMELEAIGNVLRSQVDKASEMQSASVREVQRSLDRSEFEVSRLKERNMELDKKSEVDANRVIALEKEIAMSQENIFKKEREKKEEKQKADVAVSRLDELRTKLESEIDALNKVVELEKQNSFEIIRNQKLEMDQLKKNVSERLPKIAAMAVEKMEGQWVSRLEDECKGIRNRYENQLNALKKEIIEKDTFYSERESRQRSTLAEEKSELERLRYQNQRLSRKAEELETELDDKKREMRRSILPSPIIDDDYNHSIRMKSKNPSFILKPDDETRDERGHEHYQSQSASATKNQAEILANETMLILQSQLQLMKQQLSMSLATSSSPDKIKQKSNNFRFREEIDTGGGRNSPKQIHGEPETVSYRGSNLDNELPEELYETPSRRRNQPKSDSSSHQSNNDENTLFTVPSFIQQQRLNGESGINSISRHNNSNYLNNTKASTLDLSNYYIGTKSNIDQQESNISFDGIQDGGYHEGYWKAKYSR